TIATASHQARCFRRARPRATQISPKPRTRASVLAAPGTPGGRTPLTRSIRSAISCVRAETIESRPAAVANHATRTGVAGRRTGTRYPASRIAVLALQEDLPQLVLLARLEDRQHLVAGLELRLVVGDRRLAVANDGNEPCAVRELERPDPLALAICE